jgi:DNA-binding MarR family transcriptional regulator
MPKDLSAADLLETTISVAAHIETELEEALAEHRLSRPSFNVLAALQTAPGQTLNQRALVAKVRRTSGTMSVRLGRLEHAGLIARERDPDNRRNVTVTLTRAGLDLIEAARPTYDERAERLAAALAPEARAALSEHLPAWLAFFEPDERLAPRLGVAVAPSAVAARMRRAVGLSQDPGVLVLRVKPGSAADQGGLAQGDLVVAVDGGPVRSIGDLDRAVRSAETELGVAVLRGADPRKLTVRFDGSASEDRP